ncbi:hypothetical protein QCD79_15325, partial [Pseudomonas quasicaspiana]|nr:hypothetical protein [Pseudomonas quasicaspiana]
KVESAPSPVRVLDAFKDESPTRYFYAGLYKLLACVDGHHTSRSLPRKRVIGGFCRFFSQSGVSVSAVLNRLNKC